MADNAIGRDPVRDAGEGRQWKRDRANDPQTADKPVEKEDRLGVEVVAAAVSIVAHQPVVLTARLAGTTGANRLRLPSTRFAPGRHETLETALRSGLGMVGGAEFTYLEQLAADCRLSAEDRAANGSGRTLSIGYLALVRSDAIPAASRNDWVRIYDLLPWEDWRKGRPKCLSDEIEPALLRWSEMQPEADRGNTVRCRLGRLRIAFGFAESSWDDERVVERLDLMEEAGLLAGSPAATLDTVHCRIAAAALGRLRAKIRHRPVVFELLPSEFTLFELQRAVEAILGPNLHKQNFRRLVEGMGLVEPTGEVKSHTGGRPARLFRFRPEVMLERSAPGMRIRAGKAA